MNWDPLKGHYVLKSGRTLPANLGVLGVDKFGQMTAGYDNHPPEDEKDSDSSTPPFTLQERAEIAEYQRERWARWVHEAASIEEPPPPKPPETYTYTVRSVFVPTHAQPHRFEPFGIGKIGKNFCGIAGCGKLKSDQIHV